jgi:beta-lactamase superfamily II metal-dependent hydrolase
VKCQFAFLAVGNADSIIIAPQEGPAIIVDMPRRWDVVQWLTDEHVERIAAIYFTHGHSDHFTLSNTMPFLSDWLKQHEGSFITVYFSTDAVRDFVDRDEYHDAVAKLLHWEKEGRIAVARPERNTLPYQCSGLSIRVLHPGYLTSEIFSARFPRKKNEVSVVLQVKFGKFVALLLADIEGGGIAALLEKSGEGDLRANVVKIPHHGGWPHDGSALSRLLQAVSADLAVLSVGSKNPYGHVVPDLFKLLISLKDANNLGRFICTEVTRTCLYSVTERDGMKQEGLPERRLCAGNIVIVADDSGGWSVRRPVDVDHAGIVQQIRRAACEGRAEL